jgi:hypothetical protein
MAKFPKKYETVAEVEVVVMDAIPGEYDGKPTLATRFGVLSASNVKGGAEELVRDIVGTVQDFTIFSNDEGKLPAMAEDFVKGARISLNFQYNAENGRTWYRRPWVNPLQTDISILTAEERKILGL